MLQASGIVGHLLSGRQRRDDRESAERIAEEDRADTEAARLVTDRAAFTDALLAELAAVRQRHAADIAEYERRLDEAQKRADDARTDARRWRHLLGSFGIYIMVLRRLLATNGIVAPRFDWSTFEAEGGDRSEFEGIE